MRLVIQYSNVNTRRAKSCVLIWIRFSLNRPWVLSNEKSWNHRDRTCKSQLQQSPGIFGNQFQGGSQVILNSSNFGSPLQFSSGGYGGIPHYEGSGRSGTNGGRRGNVGYDKSDNSIPEY